MPAISSWEPVASQLPARTLLGVTIPIPGKEMVTGNPQDIRGKIAVHAYCLIRMLPISFHEEWGEFCTPDWSRFQSVVVDSLTTSIDRDVGTRQERGADILPGSVPRAIFPPPKAEPQKQGRSQVQNLTTQRGRRSRPRCFG